MERVLNKRAVTILFPNQLFQETLVEGVDIFLVEHPLFFTQLPFHSHKLAFHHASLRAYRDQVIAQGYACEIISSETLVKHSLLEVLAQKNYDEISVYEPRDDFLSRELRAMAKQLTMVIKPSPGFLTSPAVWLEWIHGRKVLRMHEFYQWQRKRLNILMDGGSPIGGKWSFDTENRKAIPKTIVAPEPFLPTYSTYEAGYIAEAAALYPHQSGAGEFHYPITHAQAAEVLTSFLQTKLVQFGDYEDAVRRTDSVLFHSQLSPLINAGLLTPHQVVTAALDYAAEHDVPLNSLEGFIRQVIGWREFMSLTYLTHGRKLRMSNGLGHHGTLPTRFWEGKTGILPVDHVVTSVRATAYAHHIERLMIIGVFMLLTETEPTEAYAWFYAMFIDAYDWVMVPNVYSMSQYADGGFLTTKPYLCGSAYIRKMTDFPSGEWCTIWDSLYWRWVGTHQALLQKNPRTSMSVAMWNKFSEEKRAGFLETAEHFLATYRA